MSGLGLEANVLPMVAGVPREIDSAVVLLKRDFRVGLSIQQNYLNVSGLALTIAAWPDDIDWEKMVEAQKGLIPEVFGKWAHFIRENGEELARKSLLGSLLIFLREYDWERGFTEQEAATKISKHFVMTPADVLTRTEMDR